MRSSYDLWGIEGYLTEVLTWVWVSPPKLSYKAKGLEVVAVVLQGRETIAMFRRPRDLLLRPRRRSLRLNLLSL